MAVGAAPHGGREAAPRQQTLAHGLAYAGEGRATGSRVAVSIRPAASGTGITFVRTDRGPARPTRATLATCAIEDGGLAIAAGAARIGGIEALLAAFWAAGIDNVLVEVSGPELPWDDRGPAAIALRIACAGVRSGHEPRRLATLARPIAVAHDGGRVWVDPARQTGFRDLDRPADPTPPVALLAALVLLSARPGALISFTSGTAALYLAAVEAIAAALAPDVAAEPALPAREPVHHPWRIGRPPFLPGSRPPR